MMSHPMQLEARSSLAVVCMHAERCYRAGGLCSMAIAAEMRSHDVTGWCAILKLRPQALALRSA